MAPSPDLSQIRTDYKGAALDEAAALADPFAQFARWMDEAIVAEALEPTAMTLATVREGGLPDARIVLLKGADARGFVFYTNYDSAKGAELLAHPACALVFFWPELERQVRISGAVAKTTEAESTTYFSTRPRKSRLSALASPQSKKIASRAALEALFAEAEAAHPSNEIPRPDHWGGYRVTPKQIEFWQGRRSRLHDRLRYERDAADSSKWTIVRLAP